MQIDRPYLGTKIDPIIERELLGRDAGANAKPRTGGNIGERGKRCQNRQRGQELKKGT